MNGCALKCDNVWCVYEEIMMLSIVLLQGDFQNNFETR